MNNASNKAVTPLSMEEGIHVFFSNAQVGIRRRYLKYNKCISKSPTTAVIGAAAVGYILHRLPVRAILVTQVRVLSALTPPALILFGAAKLYDFLQKQDAVKRK